MITVNACLANIFPLIRLKFQAVCRFMCACFVSWVGVIQNFHEAINVSSIGKRKRQRTTEYDAVDFISAWIAMGKVETPAGGNL